MAQTRLTHADASRRIQAAAPSIRALGVRRLALFGSVGRDAASPGSDVDILVEFQPGEKRVDRFMGLADLLEDLLARPVDLLTTESLSPYIGPRILAEAVDVLRAP